MSRRNAMLGAAALLPIALCGCQKQLFPNSMSPTQLQQRQMDGDGSQSWYQNKSSLYYYDLDDGDNEDPSVDQGAYPSMSEPWWNSPGYIGG